MKNWFPLSKSMMEDSPEFRSLTPTEKVFWLCILSEVNLRGEFYKADLEWAVTLALSLPKVRQARRKFQALGWLKVKPGYKARGAHLATQYDSAKWARPEEHHGFFAQMPRYTWEWFLVGLRLGRRKHPSDRLPLGHDHLIVYAYLHYFWDKYGGRSGVFLQKRELQRVTKLRSVGSKVEWLADASESLIKFRDEYHGVRLLEFAVWKEPSKCAAVEEERARDTRTLKQAIATARERLTAIEKKQAKAKALSIMP